MAFPSSASPPGAAESRRTEGRYPVVIASIILLGAFLRLNRYLLNPSFTTEEAQFALNIIERTPLQLIGPLGHGQHSPAGFSVLVKFVTLALGASEPVLRLTPLLFGMASLPIFYIVANRWLPKGATLLAVTLLAVSDALGKWSAEFEKYSSDATLTLAIILVAMWFSESRRRSRYLVFAVVGAVAVWFSYPVSIVLAGIGLVVFFDAIHRRSYSEALVAAAMAACWLASFVATYALSTGAYVALGSREHYWDRQGGFLTFPPTTITQVEEDIAILVRPFEDPLGFALYSGVVLLYWVGAVNAVQKGGPRLFLVTPILAAVVLSPMGLYPITGRLLLFAVPLLLLTVVMGIMRLGEMMNGRIERLLAFVFLALVLFQPLRLGLARGLRPRDFDETRPVMIHLSESFRPGDAVVVYYWAEGDYAYYAHLLGFDQVVPSVIKNHPDAPEEYCQELAPHVGLPRVWIVFSHVHGGPQGNEEKIIVDCLDRYGGQLSRLKETGASLYLYDLRTDASGPPPGG